MKRKLIKQGLGGYTITLPIDWIREFNLRDGEEVELNPNEEGILISAKLNKREKSVTLDFSKIDDPRMLTNLLNQAYRLGYDVITIKYTSEVQLREINSITSRQLLGFEVVKSDSKFCVLQNIAEPDPEKFEVMLRKFFLICKEMSQLLSEVSSKNMVLLEDYKLQNDRLANYLRRTLIRSKIMGDSSNLLYLIVSYIAYVNHSFYSLLKYSNQKKVSATVKNLSLQLKKYYEDYYSAFYSKDLTELSRLGKERVKFDDKVNLWLEKSKGPDNVACAHLKEASRMIQICLPPTIGLVIKSMEMLDNSS
ncbi:MAG: AbrB/MazE/SpoVT family DNA-binding domain-containing protein [Candidatus Woesearchaeota archaeon]|jgi:phosphate uptake regulator